MPHQAPARASGRRPRRALEALEAWHDARPRASFATARGWWWGAFVAASFVWMSNPTVFLVTFYTALVVAREWALVIVVVSLPFIRLPRVPWPWAAFLLLGMVSKFWTINEFHTYITNTVYLQITALALVVAANCTPRLVAWSMGTGGAAVAFLSLYAYFLKVPGAVDIYVYEWGVAGIGTNKNILAYTVVVALAALLALGFPPDAGGRAAWLVLAGSNVVGLWVADSATGLLAAMGVLLAAVSTVWWPHIRARRAPAVVLALGIGLVSALGLLVVTLVLNKDLTTFSGRAPFWTATIRATWNEAPWLGSGWGAVWEHPWDPTPPNDVAIAIYERAGYALPHGHNFFVDVVPELGLVGVIVAVLMIAYAIREVRRCGVSAGASDPVTGRAILFVLVALLLTGITEPMLTVPLGWWAFVLVVALPRQGLRYNRLPARWLRSSRSRGRRVAR